MHTQRDRLLYFAAGAAIFLLLLTITHKSTYAKVWTRSDPDMIQSPVHGDFSHSAQTPFRNGDVYLQERIARAEKLWAQSIEDRQIMLSGYDATKTLNFPNDYVGPYNIWDFVRPSFFCPHDLERVGTLGDGGKWVCGMSRYEKVSPGPSAKDNKAHPLIMYSFGVNDDSSFEAALLERTNIEIWGYDYTVDHWAKDIPMSRLNRAHFKKAGIGLTNASLNPPFYSVQDLMKENGHEWIDIMKMDIEGAEFTALESFADFIKSSMSNNQTLPIGQLLLELHIMGDPSPTAIIPKTLETFLNWWRKLEDMGLRPVNNEDNWLGDAGSCRPNFMEYTIVNSVDKQRNVLMWT